MERTASAALSQQHCSEDLELPTTFYPPVSCLSSSFFPKEVNYCFVVVVATAYVH